ncbi:MAG: outer membrane protein assembly factor BamE [Thermoanaerobaculum sp.]|nr:outer membrane protein assembly factor BamE [Thermoanaerobaculum sp.]
MRAPMAVLGIIMVAVSACGKKEEQKPQTDLKAQLGKVKALHAQHLEKAQQVRALRAELAALREKPSLSSQEAQRKQALEEQLKQATKELDQIFTDDQNELASFLNTALNEAPQAPETLEGLKLYAEDAMMNARDFMNEAGDYRRAVELLETAQGYFESVSAPVPTELQALLQEARTFRHITKERFDQVQKGMTRQQVKAITGTPLALNVREQEVKGKKVTVWLFRAESGEIASFFFDEKGKLYSKDWKAGK